MTARSVGAIALVLCARVYVIAIDTFANPEVACAALSFDGASCATRITAASRATGAAIDRHVGVAAADQRNHPQRADAHQSKWVAHD